jgi:hypothetical protein
LQRYIQDRIIAFSGERAFAQRLHLAASVVQKAATDTLQELSVGEVARIGTAVSECSIVFRHDCLCVPGPSGTPEPVRTVHDSQWQHIASSTPLT